MGLSRRPGTIVRRNLLPAGPPTDYTGSRMILMPNDSSRSLRFSFPMVVSAGRPRSLRRG
jgi:hypothetical protein